MNNKEHRPDDNNPDTVESLLQRIESLESALAESARTIQSLRAGDDVVECQKKYQEFAELLPQVVFEADEKSELTFVNRAAFVYFRYSPEDFQQGINIIQVIAPEDRQKASDNMRRIFRGEKPGDQEYTMLRKDGSTFPAVIYSTPVFRGGKAIGLRGILIDISGRKAAEEEQRKLQAQLIQAHKMEAVGQLSGGVAHDFNNILTAINCYGDTALSIVGENDPVRAYINHILSLADKAAHLTRSLLAFSRKQTINPKPCRVAHILYNVKTLLSRLLGENIELDIVTPREILAVMADSTQIEQVLINLAANARDAMTNGGRLVIETGEILIDDNFIDRHRFGAPGRYAFISVSDTGLGMDEQTRARIFEPFFTTKEVGTGTGLGLSIVYGIVKQHNGYVTVESEIGKGTKVTIYLPLTGETAIPDWPDPPVLETMNGKETILLAEDDDGIRSLTRTMLERHGYTVIEASNGEEAVEKFKSHGHRVHLLITDVIMPKKDGRAVYEELRTIRSDIKSLFISGYPADIIQTRGVLEEGIHFVPKPFSPKDLVRKVRELLDA